MRILRLIVWVVVLGFFGTLGLRAYYLAALGRPASATEVTKITVSSGMGVNEISQLLAAKNLINSEALFKLYLRLNHLQGTLQAGVYDIPARLNLKETVAMLQHGTFDLKVTFPEGWRREEMADYLGSKVEGLSFGRTDFLQASEGLEGYLFPETYFIPRETTAEGLVKLQHETFGKKFTKELKEKAEQRGLTEAEVVILASLVEREVKIDADRAKVAGILVKRWQNDWPLEVDATIQYAVATARCAGSSECASWWPKSLTADDLAIDSPYNTRKNKGLPPQPICSPGLKALEAVVNYEETPYWFYVSDKEGKIYYGKTLDEHHENVLKYARG